MRKLIVAGGVILAAVLVAGCGATSAITKTQTVTTTRTVIHRVVQTITAKPNTVGAASSSANAASTTQSGASASQSGSTLSVQDFHGNTLDVTADGIIDPAHPANSAIGAAQAGTRLVALELTLKTAGPGTVSDDALTDTVVIGSDGQDYTPVVNPIAECTDFNGGGFTISPGDTERGCVTFQLPRGVNVKAAQFTLGNGMVQFDG